MAGLKFTGCRTKKEVSTLRFVNLYKEALDDEFRGCTTRDRALAFALVLLAEDNLYYGMAEHLSDSNCCNNIEVR